MVSDCTWKFFSTRFNIGRKYFNNWYRNDNISRLANGHRWYIIIWKYFNNWDSDYINIVNWKNAVIYYDALADTSSGTTALRIGNNVILGDIEIGNAQTTGDIKIGQSDISGSTITIGTTNTATTINGSVATTNLLTSTGGITSNGPLLMNACYLTGTTPTFDKTSLNYYVNYANITRNTNTTQYVYSPSSNTATTDSHYLNPGIYVADVKMTWQEAGGPTAVTYIFQMGVCCNTNTGVLPTGATIAGATYVYGPSVSTVTIGKNGVPIGYSYTGCFTLASANYVNVHVQLNGSASLGTITANLNGCIRRIG